MANHYCVTHAMEVCNMMRLELLYKRVPVTEHLAYSKMKIEQ